MLQNILFGKESPSKNVLIISLILGLSSTYQLKVNNFKAERQWTNAH